ncbi:MAG: SDR family oxidoreductase [Rickettsiales bacterium]|nr:SDR family oxidoreductase [Rickettsiales bacterium]
MMNTPQTPSKAVLITGAAQRVGAGIALRFAKEGYDVALHYNASEAAAKKIQQEIQALGSACVLIRHDMRDIARIPEFLQNVKRQMPHCSALINNASIFERATFAETEEELFDRQMQVNFKAPVFLTQHFVRLFGKGCVINMLDSEITDTYGNHFAYLLAKKALAAFTEMAARQLGPHFRVNGICPGILLPSNELDINYINKLAPTLPMGQIASLDQVADAALFLCGSGVTGQLLYIDGGQHLL